jgi:hypothetical protein
VSSCDHGLPLRPMVVLPLPLRPMVVLPLQTVTLERGHRWCRTLPQVQLFDMPRRDHDDRKPVRNRATAAQRLSSLRGKTARGRRCGSCTGEAPPGRPCARPAGVERCSSRSRSVAIPIDAKAYGRPLLVNARPCNRSSPHSCSGRPGELTGAAADRPDPISQIRGLRMNALRLG